MSCCNTEHIGPGQRPDNWGSPVEKDRQCRLYLGKVKMRKVIMQK